MGSFNFSEATIVCYRSVMSSSFSRPHTFNLFHAELAEYVAGKGSNSKFDKILIADESFEHNTYLDVLTLETF